MNDENRVAEHAPAHQFEHAEPTVIHHPEEDLTVLARWIKGAVEKGPGFWGVGLLLLIVIIGGASYLGMAASAPSATSQAWTEMTQAKDAPDLVRIAESHQGTPAERWGLLQAATRYYYQGFGDLPNNKEGALAVLKKALDLFSQLAKDSPQEDPIARSAALGVARTLEARNDLAGAIEQYKKISSTWPKSAEADLAEAQAKRLERPDATSFYKELYAYTKPGVPGLPPEPSGFGGFPGLPGTGVNFPVMPADHPSLDGPTIPAKGLTTPASGIPKASELPNPLEELKPKAEAAPKDELPSPFEELTPKTETPKAAPKS